MLELLCHATPCEAPPGTVEATPGMPALWPTWITWFAAVDVYNASFTLVPGG